MTEIESQLPVLESGFYLWRNAEIEYLGRQVIHIGNGKFNRLTDADWAQIKAAQQTYIDQQTEAFFQELKTAYDNEPKQAHKATLNTVLWILKDDVPEPAQKTKWLPYATFADRRHRAMDKTFGTDTPDITAIRLHYLNRANLGVNWVKPRNLEYQEITPQIAMLGYVRFLKYLEQPAEAAPVGVVKGKAGWTPDPTEARRIMNRFDTYLENEIQKERGKKMPLTDKQIGDSAIEQTCKDSSINLTEKSLSRYVKSLHGQTAKKYAGHFVGQKFCRN